MSEHIDFVDTHFHVWELERFAYPWPTPDMRIYKNHYPCNYEGAIKDTPVKHGIFVQCLNASPQEAEWVMDMATRHPVIQGVVAGLDLTSDKLEADIEQLQKSGLLKGSRHILDFEAPDWITREDVGRGLSVLAKKGLTYDLLVRLCVLLMQEEYRVLAQEKELIHQTVLYHLPDSYACMNFQRPHHLQYIPGVVSQHPDLKFVINHISKPPVVEGKLAGWKEDMAAIAKFPNVYCKLSGLISEQEPVKWKEIDFRPFINHVVSIFGTDWCMFGSDWPVFQVAAAEYADVLALITGLLPNLSTEEKRKVFRENAIKFYNLNV